MSRYAPIRRPDVRHINDPKPNEYDQKELFQEIAKTLVILPQFAQSCHTCWQCLQFALWSISEKTTVFFKETHTYSYPEKTVHST